jgi:spermidine synthase
MEVSKKKYDVITEEPMHPLLAGVVNLYTKEYYELAKKHLKEGGIMSQWIPLYNLSVEDVRMLAKTFRSAFPHVTVWIANTDIFMIGSMEEVPIDYERIRERLADPRIRALLSEVDLEEPAEFLSTFVMGDALFTEYTSGAPVITDDRPLIEFTGPRSLAVNTISPNIGELIEYRESVQPYLYLDAERSPSNLGERLRRKYAATLYNLVGRAYYADGNMRKANEYFVKSLRVDPSDRVSLHYRKKFGFPVSSPAP